MEALRALHVDLGVEGRCLVADVVAPGTLPASHLQLSITWPPLLPNAGLARLLERVLLCSQGTWPLEEGALSSLVYTDPKVTFHLLKIIIREKAGGPGTPHQVSTTRPPRSKLR